MCLRISAQQPAWGLSGCPWMAPVQLFSEERCSLTMLCLPAAAHGLCGIVMVMLQSWPELQTELGAEPAAMLLRAALHGLTASQFPSGNLPSSLGKETDK